MRTFPLWLALLLASFDLHAQTPVPAAPTPFWLGDPGVDVEKARAAVHRREAERLRWEQATSIGDYERIGQQDPRWDADVHKAFDQYVHLLAQETNARTVGAKPAIQRARALGCQDPMLSFMCLELKFYPSGIDEAALAKMYAQTEQDMEHSGYSPLRKLWASFRAAEKASKARKPTAAGEKQAAPEGTDVSACLVRARAHLVELLRDPAVQRDSLYAAAYAFLGYAQDDPTTAAAVMDPLAVAFETKGAEAIPPTANTKLIEGLFWVDYAWQARTRRWARNVSEEGWRLFGQRLPKAAAALEAAYALDPGDEHISNTMLTVELGQGTGRPRMESWFRRAMDANPDAWVPCVSKLEYVKPRWYGSEADVLAFGRECLATENWRVSQPLILLEAHKFLAEDSGDPAAYWKKPEVWTDVRQVCQGMLATFPNAHFRTMYALYAYRAGQWKLADEQCRLLGEKPDLFGLDTTKAQYTEMCQAAAAKVQAESPAPAP